jgi:hypothetical protein
MWFDPVTGFVRRIRLGEREVLRGIYAAVRDHNWDTIAPALRFTTRRIGRDRFLIRFVCTHRRAGIRYRWRGRLEGSTDGTLVYRFDGEALTAFRKNRIGFCVLHPLRECAGAQARQTRTDGSVRRARFPAAIEPQIFGQSSFKDLTAIEHEVTPGCRARVEFAGDVFEMEDQRNWTDASFKTYCTPLLAPFPVAIPAGHRISQRITLRLLPGRAAGRPLHARRAEEVAGLELPARPSGHLPRLGLGVASHRQPLGAEETARLRELQLAHLRVDVRLGRNGWERDLARAAAEAAALAVPLELALHLPALGEADPEPLRTQLRKAGVPLARVLALRTGEPTTTARTLAWVRRHFGRLATEIGAGSDWNFRELNHEHAVGRLGLTGADAVFWSINPQVHACDDLSVMETLEAQAATGLTARRIAGRRALVVSPLTLRQRFNPVATGVATPVAPGELPAPVDPRQREDFAAAWTVGSIAALASVRVASATCFETTGWRGLMERGSGSLLPDKFPSRPGELFPVYRVFAALAGFRRMAVAKSPDGGVLALAVFGARRTSAALVANLGATARRVRVVDGGRRRLLELPPYAVVSWPRRALPPQMPVRRPGAVLG